MLFLVIACSIIASLVYGEDQFGIKSGRTSDGEELKILTDDRNGVEAYVAPEKGGELSGLRVRLGGKWAELIYRAGDYSPTDGWRGRAPLLWPAVGRNFASGECRDRCNYNWMGRGYSIPIHGFARDLPWTIRAEGSNSNEAWLELELRESAATRLEYPFGFSVTVRYRLTARRLDLLYLVHADGGNGGLMPFSIGNHMTFRVPLVAGDLRIKTPSTIEYLKDEAGLPTGQIRARSLNTPASVSTFPPREPVSLGGYQGDPWLCLIDGTGFRVRISQHADRLPSGPLVRFNLWGDSFAGFFCTEPWVGMQNSLNTQQGLIKLRPGASWSWRVRIDFEFPHTP